MPYTFAKFFLWGLAMAIAGGVIGWLLRSLRARGQVARARHNAGAILGGELERLRGRVANLEPVVAERDRLRMELADVRGSSAGARGFAHLVEPDADAGEPAHAEPAVIDVSGAKAVLGKKIRADDLTVVEGIGPKIAELCAGIGITTWRRLADTDVATLQSMLDAAGSRFAMHAPESWPRQAAMLASGQWAEFQQLVDELHAGR